VEKHAEFSTMFLQTMDGLVAASAIVLIGDEEYPADDKTVAYRKVHYRHTSTETRIVWARPDDVESFLQPQGDLI
jgi:hypothetical protein